MTREVAINSQLSKLLDVKPGDYIYLGLSASSLFNSTPFKIVSIVNAIEFSNAPVAILHLSELQALTGNLIGDRANLILAQGNGLQGLLQSHFPDAIVLSESEFYARSITEDKRILATSVAVIIVVLVMGILFISSSMIFSVNEKQKEFAIMRAMGISDRSIMKIVLYESIMISVVGGFTGLILGYLGKYILNSAAVSSFQVNVISSTNPYILLIAFVTALLAGVISGIVPAFMGKQANIARILGN
ncbi:MAG: FtsX-like permease family protein [Candidatus Methanoperedens sp.]|nr:FtsX-like permease family protein [Candidatus Methanoperedens sp.]